MLVAAIAFLNSFPVSEFASVNHRQQLLNFSVGIGTIQPITQAEVAYHNTRRSPYPPITQPVPAPLVLELIYHYNHLFVTTAIYLSARLFIHPIYSYHPIHSYLPNYEYL